MRNLEVQGDAWGKHYYIMGLGAGTHALRHAQEENIETLTRFCQQGQ